MEGWSAPGREEPRGRLVSSRQRGATWQVGRLQVEKSHVTFGQLPGRKKSHDRPITLVERNNGL